MGSQFLEKHKRKSVLAALLFLFSGNAKYVVMLLVLVAASMPFVVSRDDLARLLENPAVSSVMRRMGLGSVLSAVDPKYSGDMLKSAMDKALVDSEQNTYWNRFLQTISGGGAGGKGGAGGGSGLDMIAGGDFLKGDLSGKGKNGKGGGAGGDGYNGVVSDEDQKKGKNGDTVYLDGGYGSGAGGYGPDGAGGYGAGGADGRGGYGAGYGAGGRGGRGGLGGKGGSASGAFSGILSGNLLGSGLAGKFNIGGGAGGAGSGYGAFGKGGGSGAGGSGGYGAGGSGLGGAGGSGFSINGGAGGLENAPFIGKNTVGGGGTAIGKGTIIYAGVMNQAHNQVPIPGNATSANSSAFGHVSGFTWKPNPYDTITSPTIDATPGGDTSMFDLTDAQALTNAAEECVDKGCAPEYPETYTSSPFDGTKVNTDLIHFPVEPPVYPPDANLVDDTRLNTSEIQAAAEKCTESQGTHGTLQSDYMTRMTTKQNSLHPPNCDNQGAVNAYNKEVGGSCAANPESMLCLCQSLNKETIQLAADCQAEPQTIDCGLYTRNTDNSGMQIKYCPKPGCKCSWKNPFCCLLWMIFWILFAAVIAAIAIFMGPLLAAMAALATIFVLNIFFPDEGGTPAGLNTGSQGTTDPQETYKGKFDR